VAFSPCEKFLAVDSIALNESKRPTEEQCQISCSSESVGWQRK
jgi:hypothetical protein